MNLSWLKRLFHKEAVVVHDAAIATGAHTCVWNTRTAVLTKKLVFIEGDNIVNRWAVCEVFRCPGCNDGLMTVRKLGNTDPFIRKNFPASKRDPVFINNQDGFGWPGE